MTTAITEFSKRVQPDVPGCPRQMVDAAVVDALIRFCEDTHILEQAFEHDVAAVDITAADNDSVNVLFTTYTGTSVRPVVLTEFRIDGSNWNATYINLLNDQDDLDEIAVQGTKFFTYPDSTHIKFYGIEAIAQRFYIKQAYAPVTTITNIDDYIYWRFHKTIEAGARAELMGMPGKDWSNPVEALVQRGLYNDGVAGAKIKKEQGFVKGSTRVKSMRWF